MWCIIEKVEICAKFVVKNKASKLQNGNWFLQVSFKLLKKTILIFQPISFFPEPELYLLLYSFLVKI